MNLIQKTFSLGLTCLALSACGGTGGASAVSQGQPPTTVNSGGLGGTSDQPFAQRLIQTEYPKSLVQDPEAMKRIQGEDTDGNGIRDDVDALITTLGSESEEIKALQQYAKTLQSGFLVNSKAEAVQFGDRLVRTASCFRAIAEKNTNRQDVLAFMVRFHKKKQEISKKTIDSFERVARMDQVDTLAHGYAIESKPANTQSCD